MCMEDIRIGNKKYNRYTLLGSTLTVEFPGDGRRVGIRLCITATTVSGNSARLVSRAFNNVSAVPICNVNDFTPTDEVFIERHGQMVKEPFAAVSIAGNALVIETFLDNQEVAPLQSNIGRVGNGV